MKEILQSYKQAPASSIADHCIPIIVRGVARGRLRPITGDTLQNPAEIKLIAEWREASADWFTTRFPLSEAGTARWLEQVWSADDRILFFVEDEACTPIGQVGLLHYDPIKKQCEFDNLLRGRKGKFGNIMIYALITLGLWSIQELDIMEGFIHVVADNYRAIRMYERLGAEEIERIPLVRVETNGVTHWVPGEPGSDLPPERELSMMSIKRAMFLKLQQSNLPT